MTDERCKLVTYMMMESENKYVILIKCFVIVSRNTVLQ